MSAVKNILNLGVDLQAIGLLGENVKAIKKTKKPTKTLVSTGMKNLIGIPLLQSQSKIIGNL